MVTNASKHQKSMTFEEFLAFEEQSLERHEFVAGEVYAFAGRTVRHNRIAGNVYRALAAAAERVGYVALIGDVLLCAATDIA